MGKPKESDTFRVWGHQKFSQFRLAKEAACEGEWTYFVTLAGTSPELRMPCVTHVPCAHGLWEGKHRWHLSATSLTGLPLCQGPPLPACRPPPCRLLYLPTTQLASERKMHVGGFESCKNKKRPKISLSHTHTHDVGNWSPLLPWEVLPWGPSW